MAEIRVRNVEDWVVSWFRSQAKKHAQSLEGELRKVLKQAATEEKRAITNQLLDDLKAMEEKYGTFSDSSVLIREDRDARG